MDLTERQPVSCCELRPKGKKLFHNVSLEKNISEKYIFRNGSACARVAGVFQKPSLVGTGGGELWILLQEQEERYGGTIIILYTPVPRAPNVLFIIHTHSKRQSLPQRAYNPNIQDRRWEAKQIHRSEVTCSRLHSW